MNEIRKAVHLRPIKIRKTTTKDLSTGALDYTTDINKNFRLLSIFMKFSSVVSPTITITLDSKNGSNYDTTLVEKSLSSIDDYYVEFGEEHSYEQGDEIKIEVSSVNATVYVTLTAEER